MTKKTEQDDAAPAGPSQVGRWIKFGGGGLVGAFAAVYAWGAQISGQVGSLAEAVKPIPRISERVERLEHDAAGRDARLEEVLRRLDRVDASADRILSRIDALAASREK